MGSTYDGSLSQRGAREEGSVSDDNSVAPIERVNLRYKSKAEGGKDVEIDFKVMVVAPLSTGLNPKPFAQREPIDINKHNFDGVMAAQGLKLELPVPDELSGVPNAQIVAKLNIKNRRDLTPDGIVEQVPEMKRQLELANCLRDIKSDLGDPRKLAELRAKIDKVLADEGMKKKLEEMKKLD